MTTFLGGIFESQNYYFERRPHKNVPLTLSLNIFLLLHNSQWQETEDFGRKKEIRSHMYKLREARLKEFYVNEMDSKAPITSRHGNAMADHSFESLKSNEIHGTDGPIR